MARRPRQPTDAERVLWRQVMRDVVPLDEHAASALRAPPPALPPPPATPSPPLPPATARPAERPPRPPVRPLSLGRAGATPGLDAASDRRLSRGELPIEARLDLHGMTEAVAHDALVAFILGAWSRDRRMLLVITGKGRGGEPGLLRRRLPHWLRQPPLIDKVLAERPARPQHGGEGATYVLLRRRRG